MTLVKYLVIVVVVVVVVVVASQVHSLVYILRERRRKQELRDKFQRMSAFQLSRHLMGCDLDERIRAPLRDALKSISEGATDREVYEVANSAVNRELVRYCDSDSHDLMRHFMLETDVPFVLEELQSRLVPSPSTSELPP